MSDNQYTTYEQLKAWIKTLTPEQLKQTAIVYFEENKAGYPISFIRHMQGANLYDDGQLVMSVDCELP